MVRDVNSRTMGFSVELQDESGGKIDDAHDPANLLVGILPNLNDEQFSMLSSLDPYGDTIFNGLQMRRFRPEWTRIASNAKSSEEQELVFRIERMAERCESGVHLYLKFISD
jgi:hypothetical protein